MKKSKYNDLELMRKVMEKSLKKNYKPRLRIGETIEDFLGAIAIIFIVALAIIFRPINLIIAGIIIIILLLI